MLRKLIVSTALTAAVAFGGLVQSAHAARVSPYSPEGRAITAQIKKLDRSIRFQQRTASDRARASGADTDRYFYYAPSYALGGPYYASGFGGYYGSPYASYSRSALGGYVYTPPLASASPGPNRGTVKYRRLVRERAALQAQLAPY